MRINYNISSIIARNALNNNDNRLSGVTQRLSSGLKINSAADNPAAMAIARKMSAQLKGLKQANDNANNGLNVVNTADGAMSEMHAILQRMNELAVQSANGTNSDGDRKMIQLEVDQLVQELDRIADTTEFNGQHLLDGSYAYKGFTNVNNMTVMSYGDGVTSGTYILNKLEYNYYDNKVTTYLDGKSEVSKNEKYEISSEDAIKKALVSTASINATGSDVKNMEGVRGFSDGCNVSIDNDKIVIKDKNDFEIKLAVNNKKKLDDSVTTTSSNQYIITEEYRNIAVMDSTLNVKYNISSLIMHYESDTGMSDIDTASIPNKIYCPEGTSTFSQIRDDLKEFFDAKHENMDIDVTDVSYDKTNKQITIKYDVTDNRSNSPEKKQGNSYTFDLYQPKDNETGKVTPTTIGAYLYQHTETVKTEYTIGDDKNLKNSIFLNMTGMGPMRVQVGANEGQVIQIEIPSLNTVNLGVDKLDISTEDKATEAIDIVGKAINQLSSIRAKIGAYANRLEHTITNLDTTEEKLTASYSQIVDADMAEEMTEYSTVQVLVQASTAMLSQANERPQQVLQLLQ